MANQADVRVRLSAEGQAEVIAAFHKVASEGKKAGHEASEGFGELNKKLLEVGKSLTGAIGVVLIAEKFHEFFKSTLEGADALDRLSKQTGVSTTAIQAFSRAARDTDVSQEAVNNGLVKFTVAVGKAEIGSKQSAAALSDLGISVRDFSKLSPDQQLEKVAQKLAAIPDPARRARDEVALFGKTGVELDQALIKIGNEGFAPFIAHLQQLGVFLDGESIESLKRSAESFKELGDTVKGVATQFLVGLVPALQQSTDEFIRLAASSDKTSRSFGQIVGDKLKGITDWSIDAYKQFQALYKITVLFGQALSTALGSVLHGDLQTAKAAFNNFREQYNELERGFLADRAAREARLKAPPAEGPKTDAPGRGGGAEGAQAAALAKARLTLLEARLDNELKLYNAHAVLVKDSDRQAYEDGQISLTEYYARRAAQINGALDQEISTLRAKRAALASSPLDINDETGKITRRKELETLDNEISIAQLRRTAELAANTNEQSNAQRKLYEDTLKAEERLLTIAGKKTEAARLKLALDIADMDAQLRKAGVSDADRAGAESTFAGQGSAQIDFQNQSQDAQTALSQLETKHKEIENQVRDGQLFSIQAAQQIVLEDQKRLPALQAQADEMVRLAALTKDTQNIAQAEAYRQKIDQIAASANTMGQAIAQQKQGFEQAVGHGINTFLTDATSGTKTLKQSFTDMARSIVADLLKMEIQALELQALKSLFGAGFSGGGAVGGTGAVAAAGGGQIRGPGTSTSDSIPARLSDGEFVVNAKTTSQPGILPLLTALNAGSLKGINGPTQVPKFAAGGQVGGGGAAPSFKMVNVLDPTTLGDHLTTDAGERAILNIISRNPSRIRNALG
jgi:hypothetical protein